MDAHTDTGTQGLRDSGTQGHRDTDTETRTHACMHAHTHTRTHTHTDARTQTHTDATHCCMMELHLSYAQVEELWKRLQQSVKTVVKVMAREKEKPYALQAIGEVH